MVLCKEDELPTPHYLSLDEVPWRRVLTPSAIMDSTLIDTSPRSRYTSPSTAVANHNRRGFHNPYSMWKFQTQAGRTTVSRSSRYYCSMIYYKYLKSECYVNPYTIHLSDTLREEPPLPELARVATRRDFKRLLE